MCLITTVLLIHFYFKMFSLVRFTNNSYNVYLSKKICREHNGGLVTIKEKGCWYQAQLIKCHDDFNLLRSLEKQLQFSCVIIKRRVEKQAVALSPISLTKNPQSYGNEPKDLNTVPLLTGDLSTSNSETDPYYTDEDPDYVPSDNSTNIDIFVIGYQILTCLLTIHLSIILEVQRSSDFVSHVSPLNNFEQESSTSLYSKLEADNVSPIKINPCGKSLVAYSDSSSSPEVHETGLVHKEKVKMSPKKHCCLYCGVKYQKIARHLETRHSNEEEVKKFASLPVKNQLRQKLIADLRKAGDFKYNSTISSENNIVPIACRRFQKHKIRLLSQIVPCPQCKGYYSKFALRMHIKKCAHGDKAFGRNLQCSSRAFKTTDIHPLATDTLKSKILNRLNDDIVGSVIRSDELIIMYGNRLCRKYRRVHFQNYQMIRSRLRTIARFLLAIRELKSCISCLKDALKLENISFILTAVEKVAKLNESGTKFDSSSTGYALTNQIKYITTILSAYYTSNNDKVNADLTMSLNKILEIEFSESINATVKETQHEIRRNKSLNLPETVHIHQFLDYLKNKVLHYYALIQNECSKENWQSLASYVLVSIQVFNRKRTGEAQNMTIDDFNSYKYINKNSDKELYDTLCPEEKKLVRKYIQVSLRSKRSLRADGTPLLLNALHVNAIKCIIKFRERVGVSKQNEFVFGTPGPEHCITLNACHLMRKFAKESGIKNNHLLRGNHLRKHIATSLTIKGCDPVTKDRMSDFMAHSKLVHKNFYELPHQVTNITKISKLLEEAAGNTDNSSDHINDSINSVDSNIQPSPSSENGDKEISLSKLNTIYPHDNLDIRANFATSISATEMDGISNDGQLNFKEKTSPTASRRSWTTPEKNILKNKFSVALETGRVPSVKECQKLIAESTVLRFRSPLQIKTWIRHQLSIKTKKKIVKNTWSTPERHLVRHEFKEHYDRQSLPSLAECEALKVDHPHILNKRTPPMIKGFFASDAKRRRQLF